MGPWVMVLVRSRSDTGFCGGAPLRQGSQAEQHRPACPPCPPARQGTGGSSPGTQLLSARLSVVASFNFRPIAIWPAQVGASVNAPEGDTAAGCARLVVQRCGELDAQPRLGVARARRVQRARVRGRRAGAHAVRPGRWACRTPTSEVSQLACTGHAAGGAQLCCLVAGKKGVRCLTRWCMIPSKHEYL